MPAFRSASRSLLLVLSAIPGLAQPAVPRLGSVPNPLDLAQPQYLRIYNGFFDNHEWQVDDDHLLMLSNGYTLLQPSRLFDASLANLHRSRSDLTVGSQFLRNATPLHDQLLIWGGRYSWNEENWSGSVWGGQTQNPFEELRGVQNRQSLVGASAAYTPSDFESYGVSLMPYASQPGGGLDRTMLMGQLYQGWESEQGDGLGLTLGYGVELGGSGSDRTALKLAAGYHSESLNLVLNSQTLGQNFGPAAGIFDPRGSQFTSGLATLKLAPHITFEESLFITAFNQSNNRTQRAQSLTHTLRYQNRETTLYGGFQQMSLSEPELQTLDGYFLGAGGELGRLGYQTQYRHFAQVGGSNDSLTLFLAHPLSDEVSIYVQEAYSSSTFGERNLQTNAGLDFKFGPVGSARIGYIRSDDLQNSFFQGAPLTGPVASANLKVRGNLRLLASVSRLYSQVGLNWIADEHNEVQLDYRRQLGDTRFFFADQNFISLGNTATLTWNTSWGGPTEARLRAALASTLRVRVLGHPPNSSEEVPVAEAVVTLQNGQSNSTDSKGDAYFAGLAPGLYQAVLSLASLDSALEMRGQPSMAVELGPGSTEELTFEPVAHGHLQIIGFNDVNAEKHIASNDYIPISGLRILGLPQPVETDSSGLVDASRLAPGNYTLQLDRQSLQPGYDLTTPERTTLEIKPGVTTRLEFGARGFGTVLFEVREIDTGETSSLRTHPADKVYVADQRSAVGRTDANGKLEASLPAGFHRFSFQGAPVYVIGTEARVEIPVNQTTRLSILLARYASLEVQLQGPERLGIALALLDQNRQTTAYTYTDAEGRCSFAELKIGRYQLVADPQSLPPGFELEKTFLNLGSSSLLKLSPRLKPKEPGHAR